MIGMCSSIILSAYDYTTYYPHHDPCKYWECPSGGGRAIEMDCPPGLYFNVDICVCDFPENANNPGGLGGNSAPECPQGIPEELPGAGITCDRGEYGRCKISQGIWNSIEQKYVFSCIHTGDQSDYCYKKL